MLAIIVYGTISLGTFITVYLFLLMGADAHPLLRSFGFSKSESSASLFLVAVAVTKLLVPIKLPLAAFIVVRLARRRNPAPPPARKSTTEWGAPEVFTSRPNLDRFLLVLGRDGSRMPTLDARRGIVAEDAL